MKTYSLTLHGLSHTDVRDIIDSDFGEFTAAEERLSPAVPVADTSNMTAPPAPAPPAPPAPAPAAEVPAPAPAAEVPAPAPAAEVERDINNHPWDARIHAKTKTKTQKGAWKKGQNIDAAIMASVELELTNAALIAGAASIGIVHEVPAPAPVAEVPAPAPVAEVPAPAPLSPAITNLIEVAKTHTCRVDISFDQMMEQVNTAFPDTNNPVNPTDIPKINEQFGITALPDVINNAELIGKIYYVVGGQ